MMNKITQKTTMIGSGGLLYQLAQVMKEIKVGEFIPTIMSMTYGQVIMDFGPIIILILMIIFDEDKIKEVLNG